MFQDIPKGVKTIPGLMTDEELSLLCRMARSASSIVELGTFKGRSLTAMMLSNPGAAAWAVDWFGDMSHRGYQGSTEAETRANFERLGVHPTILHGTTTEVAGRFDEQADLLHVDAGHSYEECRDDLINWGAKVKPGGAICIHDYGKAKNAKLDRPEVQQAVDEWRNPEWVEVERAGTMVAFRRIVAEEGVLYVAYGEKARTMAQASIESMKKHAPDMPVAVVSDSPLEGADYTILHVEVDKGARAQKTRMYSLSPFRRTLFLDADTQVLASPAPAFNLLQYGDVVFSQDPVRIFSRVDWPHLAPDEIQATKDELPTDELLYWNSGVVAFGRHERAQRLFQRWYAEWKRRQRHDQMALLRAIHAQPVRIVALREAWNSHRRGVAQFVFHAHRQSRREGAPR